MSENQNKEHKINKVDSFYLGFTTRKACIPCELAVNKPAQNEKTLANTKKSCTFVSYLKSV